jgi:hypothetical protein
MAPLGASLTHSTSDPIGSNNSSGLRSPSRDKFGLAEVATTIFDFDHLTQPKTMANPVSPQKSWENKDPFSVP